MKPTPAQERFLLRLLRNGGEFGVPKNVANSTIEKCFDENWIEARFSIVCIQTNITDLGRKAIGVE